MLSFMDYIVLAFDKSTHWNHDNSYSSLTATSDALLSFQTPSTLGIHVSSLSTSNFATSYSLSTLGQIDGLISYLYTSHPLSHVPSQTPSIPLRNLVRSYRDLRLPRLADDWHEDVYHVVNGRKPTLLYASLALPPPSTLTAKYIRRLSPETLLSLSLYSKSLKAPTVSSSPPAASVLAHVQHDTGQYSLEGLASTDSALIGLRGLWNFGLGQRPNAQPALSPETLVISDDDSPGLPWAAQASVHTPDDAVVAYRNQLASKPALLSAGAEFYYSPFGHLLGLSTGLRFTTLAPHIIPGRVSPISSGKPRAGTSASLLMPSDMTHSSYPYTMTLTLNPLVGSISSTYSVRPTRNLALSSRCDFNFYSWESRYVIGAEMWRGRGSNGTREDGVAWAKEKLRDWFTPEETAMKEERFERQEENVLKFRVDDAYNFKALWTGRVKDLLVSAGFGVHPVSKRAASINLDDNMQKWTGSVGVSVAYST